MAAIQASRFALLKIDDEYDSDESKKKSQTNGSKAGQPQSASRKKNRKKKKVDQQKENDELRNLAFGGKGTKGKVVRTGSPEAPGISVLGRPPSSQDGTAVSDSVATKSSDDKPPKKDKQWQEWKKVDKEFTADAYEKDLQQALIDSKLEFEEHKQVVTAVGDEDSTQNQGHKNKKKKKDKPAKPAAMSLGEFQQSSETQPEENGAGGDSFEDLRTKSALTPSEQDPKFFDKVDQEKDKIIRQEHMQEEYRKQYIVANAQTQQYEEGLKKKDGEVDKLKKVNAKLKNELKEVKERNQQLCHILAQGEMKGKTAVLLELDELKQVRDELTEEVSSLTTELEKERSKVHALTKSAAATAEKTEKIKGGKHSK